MRISARTRREHTINRRIISTLLAILLIAPSITHAQTGDASSLDDLAGLETAIARSWMEPVVFVEEWTESELNEQGTPVWEISGRSEPVSTPIVTDEMQTSMLSALIFAFDTPENAAAALDAFSAEQMEIVQRDPRAPATNAFTPENLGDAAIGYEGVYESPGMDGDTIEMAIVYLFVQDGSLIYQIFGQFMPGNHVEIATGVAGQMVAADASEDPAVYDMNGGSTGGLWEKLNAIELAMPEGSTITDLEIYPPSEDAVLGESVMVPVIDLDNLAAVPGLSGSWHIAYGPETAATPIATPATTAPDGVFNIELWAMEFTDPTNATAAAFSFNTTLIEPLGIVSTEGGSFGTEDSETITMVNSGFVKDRSLPEGDAAVVVIVQGTTVYAARVYANGPAPTPIAEDLVAQIMAVEPGDSTESVDGTSATGGMWELFPRVGDPLLHGLVPVSIRQDQPLATPIASPAG